jgi:energy-coupling factor transport system ATP-binding protein
MTVRYSRAPRPVLQQIDLSVAPGDVVGLTGASGTGKTSLVRSVAGLIPWLTPGAVEGEVTIDGESVVDLDPGQRAHLFATCLDRPESQLFLATVEQEIDAARRLYGARFADRAVECLALSALRHRRVTELSSGERQRVALAVAFSASPRPILLDEPTAHLDVDGEAAVVALLGDAAARGSAVVLAEQAGWRIGDRVDSWFRVDRGRVGPAGAPAAPELDPPAHAVGNDAVLSCRGLTVSRNGRPLLDEVDFDLHEGEVVALTGPNGSGKSTLAEVAAGLRAPAAGRVIRRHRTALMLPESELQLFASTVAGEVSGTGARHEERSRVLRRHRLDHLAARAPWTLSRGERQRLVHATLDLLRPKVLIVDEPGQGLGGDDLAVFFDLVRRRSAKGRAYLVISHRSEIAAAAHRRLVVRGGRLVEDSL